MEYILLEAEEEGLSNSTREEENEAEAEEEEDTGVGTLSDTFLHDSDPEEVELDNHQALLHQQREEDAHHLLSKLGGLLPGKRPGEPTARRDDLRNNNDPHVGAKPSGVQCSFPAVSKEGLQVHKGQWNPCVATGLDQENIRPSPEKPAGGKSRRPRRCLLENGVSSKDKASMVTVHRHSPYPKPLRAIQLHGTNNGGSSREQARPPSSPHGVQHGASSETSQKGASEGDQLLQRLLNAKNCQMAQLAIFKELYTASYRDITRIFKSEKTQSHEWVCVIIGCASVIMEALAECLKAHTEFLLYDINPQKRFGLYYCGFKAAKNREGVRRCFKNMNVENTNIMLCDPPNKRSVTAALFFQKLRLGHGDIPQWCADIVTTGSGSGEGFKLSQMVQWAMDNNLCDEGSIAFHYAELAETDTNAQLWLCSNSQAKYVRDATTMVRHFRRGQLHATPMMEHIAVCMREQSDSDDGDGWKRILLLLRYQHCGLTEFLLTLKFWLRGRPKKSTIAIIGVPDSGKTMFSMSLIKFLEGRVLNYANSKSHFWLQPLADCKAAVIDDVTMPCWDYLNLYMRNAMDGNSICIDCKYRAPLQMKCPPLLLTSNYDPRTVGEGDNQPYKYLFSRMSFLCFNRVIPQTGGTPRFLVQPSDWRSFLIKYQQELGLDLQNYDYGQCGEETD